MLCFYFKIVMYFFEIPKEWFCGPALRLLALPARNLFPFSVKHPGSSTHVSPSQFNDPILPMPFLAKQFVDLVIQVTNLELAKASVLDL